MVTYENNLFPEYQPDTEMSAPRGAATGVGAIALYGGTAIIDNVLDTPEVFFRSWIEDPKWPVHALPMPGVIIEPAVGFESPVMSPDLQASVQQGLELAA